VEVPSCKQLDITRNQNLLPGGEQEAQARLLRFLEDAALDYPEGRDRMDLAGTSRLSADLHYGTISARQVWTAVQDALAPSEAADRYQTQLIWRDFNASTLWDRPELLHEPFRYDFGSFPWKTDGVGWKAWVQGKTGYPVVDASARQLLAEGFVHNRARMISASFLCKHLLIDYALGEEHYMRHLVDADQAQNNAGWQWSAGCGCDAQTYFRVFNPTLQGKRFDPDGDYVRRWVPELAAVPAKFIHNPWDAPAAVLATAGVELGKQYPSPIVDHRFARARFLEIAREHIHRDSKQVARTRTMDGNR
jgi:deoxyribodipyrimidine photo-lyase